MTLINMIKDVIENGDTTKQIINKLNDKHPKYFNKKAIQLGTTKRALTQMQAEVGSVMIQAPQEFSIDKGGALNRYSIKHVQPVSSPPKKKTLKDRIEDLETALYNHLKT